MSIDSFIPKIFEYLNWYTYKWGHYVRYSGTKEECVAQVLKDLEPLISEMLYEYNNKI